MPPSEPSALAHPLPLVALALASSLTTMNPLSWLVVQRSPVVIPRSLGKLGFEEAQSIGRSKVGALKFAYCDPGNAFVPWAGGLR